MVELPAPVQEISQAIGKESRPGRTAHGVTQRHFLEREEQVRTGFDRDRALRDAAMVPGSDQGSELAGVEIHAPALVRTLFVAPLPVQVSRVAEAAGKVVQELTT